MAGASGYLVFPVEILRHAFLFLWNPTHEALVVSVVSSPSDLYGSDV
jgi:hypothetical protein